MPNSIPQLQKQSDRIPILQELIMSVRMTD